MTGHPGGIWCGAQGPLPPLQVLGAAEDGGTGGRLLHRTLPRRYRRQSGRPTFTHHLQCGGGLGVTPLGVLGGGTGGEGIEEMATDTRRRQQGGKSRKYKMTDDRWKRDVQY